MTEAKTPSDSVDSDLGRRATGAASRRSVVFLAVFVVLGLSAALIVWFTDREAHSRELEQRPSDNDTATADTTKLPAVDESVAPPEAGDYLVRSWGVRKCLAASGASDGIVMEAVLDSCESDFATIRVATSSQRYRFAPRGLAAGGDYGACLVADGTAVNERFRDGSCRYGQAGQFVLDAPARGAPDPQVFRIRHAASDFCMAVRGDRVVQSECRDADPMQEFVLESA